MESSWAHPNLGVFENDGYEWTQTRTVEGFEAYSYKPRYPDFTAGRVSLSFPIDDENPGPPAPEAIDLMARILGDLPAWAERVKAAVWDDFMGRGPDSGMYWHGHLEEVMDVFDHFDAEDGIPALESADQVPAWLCLNGIRVDRDWEASGSYIAHLLFHAAFDEEHGLGVLTDGEKVLGIGYQGDASPFGS